VALRQQSMKDAQQSESFPEDNYHMHVVLILNNGTDNHPVHYLEKFGGGLVTVL
jgi:hypothetical protein